jgi:hypothetical protein
MGRTLKGPNPQPESMSPSSSMSFGKPFGGYVMHKAPQQFGGKSEPGLKSGPPGSARDRATPSAHPMHPPVGPQLVPI